MKALLPLAIAFSSAPLAANAPVVHLPGVSDTETTIPYGDIRQSEHGHGDVIFVRDRANQWYRLQLNHGCLNGTTRLDTLFFDHHGPGATIDRFTTIAIPDAISSCAITSIRQSEAPPQVNSKSRVTLD